jgi:hypothetical protein
MLVVRQHPKSTGTVRRAENGVEARIPIAVPKKSVQLFLNRRSFNLRGGDGVVGVARSLRYRHQAPAESLTTLS